MRMTRLSVLINELDGHPNELNGLRDGFPPSFRKLPSARVRAEVRDGIERVTDSQRAFSSDFGASGARSKKHSPGQLALKSSGSNFDAVRLCTPCGDSLAPLVRFYRR